MSREFIDAIASGDNLDAENEFKDSISAKVGDVLEIRRKELSQTFVGDNEVVEEKDDKVTSTGFTVAQEKDRWEKRNKLAADKAAADAAALYPTSRTPSAKRPPSPGKKLWWEKGGSGIVPGKKRPSTPNTDEHGGP